MIRATYKKIANPFIYAINTLRNSKNAYGFAKEKQINFPYRFGGVSNEFYNNSKAQEFLKTMFFDDVENTFIQLYRKYLTALQTKDMEYLNKNVEKKLIKNLGQNSDAATLINKDSPIKIAIEKNILINSIGFERQFHDEQMYGKKMPFKSKDILDFYEGISLKNHGESYFINLFVARVYFKSSIKLIKSPANISVEEEQRNPANKKEEIHVVQFQVQNISNKNKLFLKRFVTRMMNLKDKAKFKEDMMRFTIGGSPYAQWKIGDVDRLLDGNLPKINFDDLNSATQNNNNIKSK